MVADYEGQKDVVIMNNNSRSWPTDDKDACWQLCMATSGCKSTTFGKSGKCYLKPVIATSANTQADSSRQYTVLKHCAYFTLPGIFSVTSGHASPPCMLDSWYVRQAGTFLVCLDNKHLYHCDAGVTHASHIEHQWPSALIGCACMQATKSRCGA